MIGPTTATLALPGPTILDANLRDAEYLATANYGYAHCRAVGRAPDFYALLERVSAKVYRKWIGPTVAAGGRVMLSTDAMISLKRWDADAPSDAIAYDELDEIPEFVAPYTGHARTVGVCTLYALCTLYRRTLRRVTVCGMDGYAVGAMYARGHPQRERPADWCRRFNIAQAAYLELILEHFNDIEITGVSSALAAGKATDAGRRSILSEWARYGGASA